ncbi:KDO2-lipid IV(A) lauroyltransferase [Granulicella pectinivorans]|uniref:KDO2-lipid IV(A) lauroyltransferase n=1 Tax=Granulicella pectinivorans TaxID=474950 RepID=A0A1I6M8J7_9BACT|nr:KDO2-lipid IV(A) lauroyltransferase [Granulicella pectinivorans]
MSSGASTSSIPWQQKLEFMALRGFVGVLGGLPRGVARQLGAGIGWVAYKALGRLRRVGQQNLAMALPEKTDEEREAILQRVYRNLGYQIAEFCQMAGYSQAEASSFISYDGFEHFSAAMARGKGVFVLTGHLGAWELSSFYHSLMGHPMDMVIRRLDNPLVDTYVNRIRCLYGNRVLHKDDFARGLIASMRAGRAVGVLMDTNMTPPQGVFVPFFGQLACTASGVARVVQKTGAAVLPGFLLWQETERKYRLVFGKELAVVSTGNAEADALSNTAQFTAVLEEYIRRYPDQWLWMHRRWKTRPEGEKGIYTR